VVRKVSLPPVLSLRRGISAISDYVNRLAWNLSRARLGAEKDSGVDRRESRE
jgi:hypothetical protein